MTLHSSAGKYLQALKLGAFFSMMILYVSPFYAQEVRQIEIVHANDIEFNNAIGKNVKRLLGNVIFRHGNAEMYCDSAYYFSDENRVDAFSRIHIQQGDTLHLYGDFMKYLGKTKIAQVRKNVRLIDRESHLKTEYLDFDLVNDYGYYFNGGSLDNGENKLNSKIGYYYSRLKLFFFKNEVEVQTPKNIIYSDTLKYNTVSKIAWFFGPTRILSKDNTIYCENGWYNTQLNISQFNKNSKLETKGQYLTGDSLYYERDRGYGEAFRNVQLYDSAQNVLLLGNYAWYYEKPEHAMLTGRSEMIKMNQADTIYIHADTLRSFTDSLQKKLLIGYFDVKMFKKDLQAKCDSLSYSEADTTIRLFGSPVLWSDIQQLTADHIDIYTSNRKIDHLELLNSAMIISQVDTLRFNQIRGKKMIGYFTDGRLSRINVNGNGQSIYFPKDGNEIIGMNKVESSNLVIYLKEKKIDKIVFMVQPNATLYPNEQVNVKDMLLKGFNWFIDYRPKTREDIFIWRSK